MLLNEITEEYAHMMICIARIFIQKVITLL